jgi:hypothetical protein
VNLPTENLFVLNSLGPLKPNSSHKSEDRANWLALLTIFQRTHSRHSPVHVRNVNFRIAECFGQPCLMAFFQSYNRIPFMWRKRGSQWTRQSSQHIEHRSQSQGHVPVKSNGSIDNDGYDTKKRIRRLITGRNPRSNRHFGPREDIIPLKFPNYCYEHIRVWWNVLGTRKRTKKAEIWTHRNSIGRPLASLLVWESLSQNNWFERVKTKRRARNKRKTTGERQGSVRKNNQIEHVGDPIEIWAKAKPSRPIDCVQVDQIFLTKSWRYSRGRSDLLEKTRA